MIDRSTALQLATAVCWWLSASRKWSQEAVENVSSYFHILCWALPAVLAIALLVLRKFEADELTGLCHVGTGLALFAFSPAAAASASANASASASASASVYASSAAASTAAGGLLGKHALLVFLMLPLALSLLLGVALLIAGSVALVKVKMELKQLGTSTVPLEKLNHKMILFAILYVLISLCQLGCYAYEYFSIDSWRARVLLEQQALGPAASASPAGAQPHVVVFLLRMAASLILACTLVVWIFSKKTFVAWRSLLTCVCTRRGRNKRGGAGGHPTHNYLYDPANANAHSSAIPLIALSSQQQQQHSTQLADASLNLPLAFGQRAQYPAGVSAQTLPPQLVQMPHLKSSQSLHNKMSESGAQQRVSKHKSHPLFVPTAPSENAIAAAATAQSQLPLPDPRGITPTLPSPSNLMNMQPQPQPQQMSLYPSGLTQQQQQQILTSPKRSSTMQFAGAPPLTTSATSFANMASTAAAPLAPAPTPTSFDSTNSQRSHSSTALGAQQAVAPMGSGSGALVPLPPGIGMALVPLQDVQLQNLANGQLQVMAVGQHQHHMNMNMMPMSAMQTQISLSSGTTPTGIYEALQQSQSMQHSPGGAPVGPHPQGLSVALPSAPVPTRRAYR